VFDSDKQWENREVAMIPFWMRVALSVAACTVAWGASSELTDHEKAASDPHSSPTPPAGSIRVVRATNMSLCRAMIAGPNDASGDGVDRIDESKVGNQTDWGSLTYIHPGEPGATGHVMAREIDLTNSGVPHTFYWINSGHTFTRSFFVLPPATVSVEDVARELGAATYFEEMPAVARKKKWTVIGWDIAPYKDLPFEVSVIEAAHATYVLGVPGYGVNPTAVLWKGRPDGTLRQFCVFQKVRAHA
jgi:hypothetical protein